MTQKIITAIELIYVKHSNHKLLKSEMKKQTPHLNTRILEEHTEVFSHSPKAPWVMMPVLPKEKELYEKAD